MADGGGTISEQETARGFFMPATPDPTRLTTEQLRATETVLNQNIFAAVAGLRELLETRLAAMDLATRLLAERLTEQGNTLDRRSAERHDTLQTAVEQRVSGVERAAGTHDKQVERILADAAEARDRIRDEFAAADLALRELLGARIDGMDTATKLLAVNVDQVPSDIDRGLESLKEILMGAQTRLEDVLGGEIARVSSVTLEKFAAVDALFASNATALTAALAAQEKAVAAQNDSNTLAITKSEQATKETISANANQTSTGLAGLGTVMDDLKSRVVRLEGQSQQARTSSEDSLAVNTFGQTAEQNRIVQARTNIQLTIAAISGLVAVIAVIFAIVKKLTRSARWRAARRSRPHSSGERVSPGVTGRFPLHRHGTRVGSEQHEHVFDADRGEPVAAVLQQHRRCPVQCPLGPGLGFLRGGAAAAEGGQGFSLASPR